VQINRPLPEFGLPDLHNRLHHLRDYRGRIVVLNFWSAECPHSDRTDKLILSSLQRWPDDVALLSIAANRNEPVDLLERTARGRGLPVVLLDADHAVADLFEAFITPQIFLADRDGILRYRGAVDDLGFRRGTPSRLYLDEAVESLLAGRLPTPAETDAYGCAIVREI